MDKIKEYSLCACTVGGIVCGGSGPCGCVLVKSVIVCGAVRHVSGAVGHVVVVC